VPEVICDVCPIQYLHQVGLLDLLRLRYGAITIPSLTREAGWGAVKAKLKGFSTSELVNLVRDLYQASPENRQFLRGRLLHSAADLERYRSQVTDAVFPDPFSRKPVRVGEAERLIRHYRLSTGDESGAIDLMLAMVEAGTEQAVDLGYANEAYFASLERVLESVVDALPSPPESAQPSIVERLRQVAKRAVSTGWGYGDAVREITMPAILPRAERPSSRRARRS
jgi:hypothetical protein